MGPAECWPELPGNVAFNLGVRPRAVPALNMQNPELSPDSSARTLDFVCVPHLNRQPLAAAAGIKREREARGRTQEQVREGVRNPERHHKGMVEKIGIMSPQSSYRLGDCRQPVYSAPTMAYESHYMRTLVSGCRIRVNGWAIDSAHSGRRAYWEVASRSADRARRRWLWELAIAKTVGGGAIRTESGDIMNEHSEDGHIPVYRGATWLLTRPFRSWTRIGINLEMGKTVISRGAPLRPRERERPLKMCGRRRAEKTSAEKHHVGNPEADSTVNISGGDIAHGGKRPFRGGLRMGPNFQQGNPKISSGASSPTPANCVVSLLTMDGAQARIWTHCHKRCMRQGPPCGTIRLSHVGVELSNEVPFSWTSVPCLDHPGTSRSNSRTA